MNRYTLELENDQLLNIIPLVKFLKENEGTDISLTVNQESHCLKYTRVYELLDQFSFKSVTIETRNALEAHPIYTISPYVRWQLWLDEAAKSQTFDHTFDYRWNKNKIFGCFYGRPSASRLGIAGHLHGNYPTKALIKLRFDTSIEDTRKLFELQKIYSWEPTSLNNVSELLKNIDCYYSEFPAYNYTTYEYDFGSKLNYLYQEILVDLVVEAHLHGNSFYPTEKTTRAMLCQKPFIAMSTVNFLNNLRRIGFKTFDSLWDESYDKLQGKDRYVAILKIIDYLASLSMPELEKLNNQAEEIVKHNYQWLTSKEFNNIFKN